MLPSVDVDLHTAAVYESRRGEEVNSKALSTEHVVTHQHICLQPVNQVQLAADRCVDLIVFFMNTRDIDCRQGKVSRLVLPNANAPDFQRDWHCADFLGRELFCKPVSIHKGDSAPCIRAN